MNRRELLALTAAALLVRGLLLFLRADYLDWDESLYIVEARNILAGSGLTLNGLPHIALGPFVPIATAFTTSITGFEPFVAQRLLMAIAGALLVPSVWYLLQIHAGQRIARNGAVLLVGWLALIDVAPKLGPMWRHLYAGSEPVFLALLFGGFALGEAGLRGRRLRRYAFYILAGVCLASAMLARPEALVVAGIYAVVRTLPWWRSEKAATTLTAFVISGATALVLVTPYLAYMRQHSGTWMLSGKLEPTQITSGLYQELVRDDRHMGEYLRSWWALDDSHTQLVNPYWGTTAALPFKQRVADYRRVLAAEWTPSADTKLRRLTSLGSYLAVFWVLGLPLFLPFAVLGVLWRDGEWQTRFPPFVMAGLVASVFTSLAVFALPRFFLYLVPALALWAARGVQLVSRWVPTRKLLDPDRALTAGLLLAALAVAGVQTLGVEASNLRGVGLQDRLASKRLAESLPSSEPVMTWHPRLAYWGGLDWRALPVASLDDVVHYAAARGIRVLFLSRGGYSPLVLEVPYVVITITAEVSETFRELPLTDDSHSHPSTRLEPSDPIAGFPAGRVVLRESEAADGDNAS